MRNATLALLLCLTLSSCKEADTTAVTTATETSDTAVTTADLSTIGTDGTSTSVASVSTEVPETDTSSTSPISDSANTEATSTAPPAGSFPDLEAPKETSKKVRYEYMVDTFYEWPDSAVQLVAKRVGMGVQFFNTKQQQRIVAFRAKQGWEVRRRFRVPGTPTEKANPFINYQRHIVVYRRPR